MTTTFGPFTLDDAARQLCRGAEPIHLSPKAFDLLTLLVQRRPGAISKSDILDTLWRDTFVTEGNLAVLVKEIRDALGDDAQRPAYIRTVQRFGYAFAATVAERHASAAAGVGSAVDATRPSIAVLPFANMSADPANEYFSDGLAEEILNELTHVPGLRVIARSSAFAFKGKHDDIRRIAEALDVTHVLEGSVRKSGNRIRVTAQLIAARDGSHVWAERYDREVADVFAIQDDISGAIGSAQRVTFSASGSA